MIDYSLKLLLYLFILCESVEGTHVTVFIKRQKSTCDSNFFLLTCES